MLCRHSPTAETAGATSYGAWHFTAGAAVVLLAHVFEQTDGVPFGLAATVKVSVHGFVKVFGSSASLRACPGSVDVRAILRNAGGTPYRLRFQRTYSNHREATQLAAAGPHSCMISMTTATFAFTDPRPAVPLLASRAFFVSPKQAAHQGFG